jgi:hypothetical protein
MNRPDARMREWASNESDILQSGQPDVADILAATAHEPVVLLAEEARTDPLAGASRSGRGKFKFAFDG